MPKTTKKYARYYALVAAVDILRNHGFEADPCDIPDEQGRRWAGEAFAAIIEVLEAEANQAVSPTRSKAKNRGGTY